MRVVMGDVMFWPAGSRFHVRTPPNATFACILFNPKNWTRGKLAHTDGRGVLPNACRMMINPCRLVHMRENPWISIQYMQTDRTLDERFIYEKTVTLCHCGCELR
jgi:hypothetical protein